MTDDLFGLPDTPLPAAPSIDQPGTCRATRIVHAIEWICVAPVHATEESIRAGNPQVDRHMFVNRYPHRPTGDRT